MTDVISVTLTHFAGEQPVRPQFDLATDEPEVEVRVDDEVATLTSGLLSARVHRGAELAAGVRRRRAACSPPAA